MDLKNLESFIMAAETGSFTKAAAKLGYSQSTISFQIKQLEKDLGTPLFERINHTIKLTPKGRQILSLAHQMTSLSDDMMKVACGVLMPSGHVRIAMADSLCHWLFWDNFATFHKKYPDISLTVISASTEEMFRLLKQNETDMVYTLDRHIYSSHYVIAAEKQVNAHFIAASSHPLCQRPSISIPELISYPFILTERGMSYRKLLEDHLSSISLAVHPFLEIGDTSLICRLVEQDMGISFLPDYVTEGSVTSGKVRRLSVTGFSPDIWIQLLYHRDKWRTPEMQCVIDYLKTAKAGESI